MATSHVHTADLSDEQLQTLVEVILAVAYGDGELGDAERHTLRGYLSRLGDDRLEEAQVEALLLAASLNLERDGIDARLRAARTVLVDEEAKRVAVRLAYGAARADGYAADERAALHQAAGALGLDDGIVDRIEAE